MVLYKTILTPNAETMLDGYIDYIYNVLKNHQAAENVWRDAMDTQEQLKNVAESLKPCKNPKLKALGYRKINFIQHQYVMLYRVVDDMAYIDAIYHQLQDYENIFAETV